MMALGAIAGMLYALGLLSRLTQDPQPSDILFLAGAIILGALIGAGVGG